MRGVIRQLCVRARLCVRVCVYFRKVQFGSLSTSTSASVLLPGARLPVLPGQKASCDRPSSDGELTHENGHADCKDQGESPQPPSVIPDSDLMGGEHLLPP